MDQKGTTFDHDFYVVGKQCRTENACEGHKKNIFIYKLTNVFFYYLSSIYLSI